MEAGVTAEIIQIRDHQSRRQREHAQAALEQQAVAIMTNIMSGEPVPHGQEPTIYIDTGPCEMIPYHAPLDDPA